MFPLGTVLFPSQVAALHVFEQRYRTMVDDCLSQGREFGVVLIERGSEVGGGDVRTGVGTIARISEARELPDGRWLLAVVGTRRLRVVEWLDDDPYPRAEIEEWPDGDDGDPAQLDAARALLRRALALKAELGEPAVPIATEVSDEAGLGSFQVAALAPIGPADQQELLRAEGAGARLALLVELLEDEVTTLEGRLSLG